MPYRLIALDLDGTLLDDHGTISRKNIDYLKMAFSKGVRIIITTGRSYPSAAKYISSLGLSEPVITYNGAMIQENSRMLKKITMDDSIIHEILLLLKGMDFAPIVYPTDNLKYYETLGNYSDDFLDFSRGFERELIKVSDIINHPWHDILRISVIAEYPDLSILHAELKKRFGNKIRTVDTYFPAWKFWIFEILDANCSKARGISYLCERYEIDQQDVVAVGDNNNDLDMIVWAGMGVAMKNGLEAVLREADYVTERSNNEDGVAEVIGKFILSEAGELK